MDGHRARGGLVAAAKTIRTQEPSAPEPISLLHLKMGSLYLVRSDSCKTWRNRIDRQTLLVKIQPPV
jgi:hypothetical protein